MDDIFSLIENDDYEGINLWLLDDFYDKNIKNHTGDNPLLYAISNKNQKAAYILIEQNSYVNDPNHYKNYPIHWASALGMCDLALSLIERGADITVLNMWKQTPLADSVYKHALNKNYAENLKTFKLLLDHGAPLFQGDYEKLRRSFLCKNLVSHYAKLQKFIIVIRENKVYKRISNFQLLKFSQTFKFSFKE